MHQIATPTEPRTVDPLSGLACIACVVTKALTDLESGRVFLRNQKLSREWGLLHNLFWSQSGNAFANVTYGGFTLIIALMLISRFIDAKSRPSLVEKIFLTVGMLCFFAMGGLVFAAYDQVPDDLHDNAIILGCLSFFVSLLILIDLADPMARHTTDTTQTENNNNNNNNNENNTTRDTIAPLRIPNGTVEGKQINNITSQPPPTQTSIQVHEIHEDSRSDNQSPNRNILLNGNYHRNDEVDFVQIGTLPTAEEPVFEKVLLPEKRRPQKQNIPDPRVNMSQTEFVTEIIRDQRQTSENQNNFSHHDQYHNHDNRYHPKSINPSINPHQNYGYVRDYNLSTRRSPLNQLMPHERYDHRPLMVIRDYSNSRNSSIYNQSVRTSNCKRNNNFNGNTTRKSYCKGRCSSDEDENVSAIQPGFVANAAKIWDKRAKRDFNTVV